MSFESPKYQKCMGVAFSSDGIHWKEYGKNPVGSVFYEQSGGCLLYTSQLLYDSCIWFIPVENVRKPVIYSDRIANVTEEGYMIVSNMNMTYAYLLTR